MLPNMNKRQMDMAMKKLGIQEEKINAIAVIIRTPTEDIIIRSPEVSRVNMMGNMSYSVSGEEEHRPLKREIEISVEDIKTVAEQSGCTIDEARAALAKTQGDLAEAIILLQGK